MFEKPGPSHRFTALPALLLAGAVCIPAQAGVVSIQGVGGAFTVPVDSLQELRWETVIRQQYDFSCGSAAVATLLTYHYDMPVNEAEVFERMYRAGNKEKIQAEGFSMLDMKRYLDHKGLHSDGFRMSLDKLVEIGVPAIVLVNTNGYRHFVVVRGLRGDTVLLADPAIGSIAISRQEFERIWDGTVLAARAKLQVARENFNTLRDWDAWPTAPISKGVDRSGTGMFLLSLPGSNELGR